MQSGCFGSVRLHSLGFFRFQSLATTAATSSLRHCGRPAVRREEPLARQPGVMLGPASQVAASPPLEVWERWPGCLLSQRCLRILFVSWLTSAFGPHVGEALKLRREDLDRLRAEREQGRKRRRMLMKAPPPRPRWNTGIRCWRASWT